MRWEDMTYLQREAFLVGWQMQRLPLFKAPHISDLLAAFMGVNAAREDLDRPGLGGDA